MKHESEFEQLVRIEVRFHASATSCKVKIIDLLLV